MFMDGDEVDANLDRALVEMRDQRVALSIQHAQAIDEGRYAFEVGLRNFQAADAAECVAVSLADPLTARDEFASPLDLRDADAGQDIGEMVPISLAQHVIFPGAAVLVRLGRVLFGAQQPQPLKALEFARAARDSATAVPPGY